MAALIIIAITLAGSGLLLGLYLRICFAIRREDRSRESLQWDAPDPSTRAARALAGINGSRWG